MCRTMQKLFSSPVVRSLTAFLIFGLCCNGETPERCLRPRPTSDSTCGVRVKRFFFKQSLGRCKFIRLCPQDAERFDNNTTDENYFLTKEACQEVCPDVRCPDLTPVRDAEILSRNQCRNCHSGSRSDRSSDSSSESSSGSQRDYTVGHTVIYRCAEDLVLIGDAVRTCQENGTWSGCEPRCDAPRPHCPGPAPIDHGMIDEECIDWSIGCIIRYTCSDNHTLVGSGRRTCLETGQWSSPQPICGRIKLVIDGRDVSNTEQTITEGTQHVSITCRMVPRTYPEGATPVWRFTLNSRDPHGIHISGETLKFDSIQNNHNGNYTCCIGGLSASAVIHVRTTVCLCRPEPPELVLAPIVFNGIENKTKLYCVFSSCPAGPAPEVFWFHNDNQVSSNEINRQIKSLSDQCRTISELTINSVNAEDRGGYKCVGQNNAGTASSEPVLLEPSERRKRSADGEESPSSLCSQNPDSVTLVGRIRRRARALQNFHSLGVRVQRVIRGTATGPLLSEKKRITVFLHQGQKAVRLKKDTTVVLTGRIINDKLFILEDNSIQLHSPELEHFIKTC